ncbi:hypothetical protein BC938DRAFT_475137 [Jimgerdemannia flammicorona]|uniref:Uncharacterized protein n=1 Tax=Jimgerdemannia flammicorona TaxID=994334 RepID=A0A433QZF0_9FUNG|nr:hypothetical protein BC938DRAFT_475137 [Jimgerdemannia flammicorona]
MRRFWTRLQAAFRSLPSPSLGRAPKNCLGFPQSNPAEEIYATKPSDSSKRMTEVLGMPSRSESMSFTMFSLLYPSSDRIPCTPHHDQHRCQHATEDFSTPRPWFLVDLLYFYRRALSDPDPPPFLPPGRKVNVSNSCT